MTGKRDQQTSSEKQRYLYQMVGRRVREARLSAKLTQETLASRVALTRTSVTNIEKGRQKLLLHTLFDLAAALKVPISGLLPENLGDNGACVEKRLSDGLSKAEREWIINSVSKPLKIQKQS